MCEWAVFAVCLLPGVVCCIIFCPYSLHQNRGKTNKENHRILNLFWFNFVYIMFFFLMFFLLQFSAFLLLCNLVFDIFQKNSRGSEVCLARCDSYGNFAYLNKNQAIFFNKKFVGEDIFLKLWPSSCSTCQLINDEFIAQPRLLQVC